MRLKIYHIDAFTNEVFKGNYAAVVVLNEWLPTEVMQNIASENNLSETAFVKQNEKSSYEIRWFSPLCEINFCGHATLAASFVLFEHYIDGNETDNREIVFSTQHVGKLSVTQAEKGFIKMLFPNRLPETVSNIPKVLISALSIKPSEVLRNNQAYFALYENAQDILKLEANSELLKQLAPYDVVVSSQANIESEYDFISRYFWPANGGDEDPVTGSIHAGLAPLWAKRLHKKQLKAYQASKRGGILYCNVTDKTIEILGQAVQYLVGEISIDL